MSVSSSTTSTRGDFIGLPMVGRGVPETVENRSAMAKRRSRKPESRQTRRDWPQLRLPALEQRHFDLIGLGLVAFAAFFAAVFYLGRGGGGGGGGPGQGGPFLFRG